MFRLNLWTRPFLHPSPGGPGMENNSFLPNPLASPALMVLAHSAEGRDGQLPQSHPLAAAAAAAAAAASQGSSDGKDPSVPQMPFTTSGFPMFRPGDHLPPPLYSHLHQPFMRPHIDPHALGLLSPRGMGSLHPHHSDDRDCYPSAFAPTKKAKLEEIPDRPGSKGSGGDRTPRSSHGGEPGEIIRRRESPYASPDPRHSRHGSPALSGVDSNSDLHSEGDRHTPDCGAKDLRKWVSADGQGVCCPICKAVLQAADVHSHLAKELAELTLVFDKRGTLANETGSTGDENKSRECIQQFAAVGGSRDVTSKSRYDTFMRIRGNREARLAKLRGRRRRLHDDCIVSESRADVILDTSGQLVSEEETIDVIGDDDKDSVWLDRSGTSDVNTSSESIPRSDESKNNNSTKMDDKDRSSPRVKCSVCMEGYTSPVTSVQCWHVHCEKCWLQALNTKKLCPQCNIVTAASDLRRIYI